MKTTTTEKTPLVSVVMTVYKGEAHVADAIRSVRAQTLADFECIIVCEPPCIETVSIVRRCAENDSRISIHINETHLGQGGSWNKGLELARGTYIKLLCHDDILEPDCLLEHVRVFERIPSLSLSTSFEQLFGDASITRATESFPGVGRLSGVFAQKRFLAHGNFIGGPSAVMFRRTDLRVGLFDPTIFGPVDNDMWIRLLSAGDLYVIPKILFKTKVHSGQNQKISVKEFRALKEHIRILEKVIEGRVWYGNHTKEDVLKYKTKIIKGLIQVYSMVGGSFRTFIRIGCTMRAPVFVIRLAEYYARKSIRFFNASKLLHEIIQVARNCVSIFVYGIVNTYHRFLFRPVSGNFAPRDHVSLIGSTRESWEECFLGLWEPLFRHFSRGSALIFLGGRTSRNGFLSDGYEGFARSFIGASFFLHHKTDTRVTISQGEIVDMADIYKMGICNGTNPDHKEYWGSIKTGQRLVENCSVAIGLLLTKKHIWDTCTDEEKKHILKWFSNDVSGNCTHFTPNNWLWFKIFHYLVLEKLGDTDCSDSITEILHLLEYMHRGDGWTSDGVGPDAACDYYSAWAMQYYSLIFSYITGEKYGEWKKVYMSRANNFLHDYEKFFSCESPPPLYGRSQIYRFASVSPWGVAVSLGAVTDEHVTKSIMTETINAFLKGGSVVNGILTTGYFKAFSPMLEEYNAGTSPYWAFKGFSALLMPPDHSFWKELEGSCSFPDSIKSIAPARMLVSRLEGSHVILFPGSMIHGYSPKYEKFAYSNIFLPNFNRTFPVDSTFLIKENGRWLARHKTLAYSSGDNFHTIVWETTSGFVVRSTIIVEHGAYIVIHQSLSDRPVVFSTGGFSMVISQDDYEKNITPEDVQIKTDKHESRMMLLKGDSTGSVHVLRGYNPLGYTSLTPFFKGVLKPKESVAFMVSGSVSGKGNQTKPNDVTFSHVGEECMHVSIGKKEYRIPVIF